MTGCRRTRPPDSPSRRQFLPSGGGFPGVRRVFYSVCQHRVLVLAGQANVKVIGVLMMQKQLDEWHVIVQESSVAVGEASVVIRRLAADGRVIEVYAPQPPAVAAVFLAAIIQGFQPPRGLVPLDKPVG